MHACMLRIQLCLQQNMRNRFTVLFELGGEYHAANVSRPSINDLSHSTLAQIAQFVATTGQTVNICDVQDWVREHNQIRAESEIDSTHAILCMPIVNAQKTVIGVAQLINKVSGQRPEVPIGSCLTSLLCCRRAVCPLPNRMHPYSRRSPYSAAWAYTTRRCTRTPAS